MSVDAPIGPAQTADMSRATVNAICRELPGAEHSDPWGGGHDAWKVGGRMFACIGATQEGVAVKCGNIGEALHLEDLLGWPKAPYFHRSWVLIPFGTDADELTYRIRRSYGLVRQGLTRKAQAALPAWEAGG